jgi:hypothetical protein
MYSINLSELKNLTPEEIKALAAQIPQNECCLEFLGSWHECDPFKVMIYVTALAENQLSIIKLDKLAFTSLIDNSKGALSYIFSIFEKKEMYLHESAFPILKTTISERNFLNLKKLILVNSLGLEQIFEGKEAIRSFLNPELKIQEDLIKDLAKKNMELAKQSQRNLQYHYNTLFSQPPQNNASFWMPRDVNPTVIIPQTPQYVYQPLYYVPPQYNVRQQEQINVPHQWVQEQNESLKKNQALNPIINAIATLREEANMILNDSKSNWKERIAAREAIKFTKNAELINNLYLTQKIDLKTYKTEMTAKIEAASKNVKNSGKLAMILANILSCLLLGAGLIYRAHTGHWFFNLKNPPLKVTELKDEIDSVKNKLVI